MNRMGRRQTIFVCVTISDNKELITRLISAEYPKEAADLFFQQMGCQPQEVLGPFFKKKTQVIESTRILKFTAQQKRAIYNDWVVDAFLLQEPPNQAYLVFIKRVDDKKLSPPKGTITVPVSELRFEQ